MKAKNHQISNNNKNIVYVINNTSIKRKSKSKKTQASKAMNYSLPPEQAYTAPDNRFLNSSNLNTEMQRTQLNLLNPKLRGKESEIEQRIFNIQNSIKEEDETLKKMNNLYSRFDSTPRFEDSINNIYGLNNYDNQGAFGETEGSDNFINEGIDKDQYIFPSLIPSDVRPDIPADVTGDNNNDSISNVSLFKRIPVPEYSFSPLSPQSFKRIPVPEYSFSTLSNDELISNNEEDTAGVKTTRYYKPVYDPDPYPTKRRTKKEMEEANERTKKLLDEAMKGLKLPPPPVTPPSNFFR